MMLTLLSRSRDRDLLNGLTTYGGSTLGQHKGMVVLVHQGEDHCILGQPGSYMSLEQ